MLTGDASQPKNEQVAPVQRRTDRRAGVTGAVHLGRPVASPSRWPRFAGPTSGSAATVTVVRA